MTNLDSNNVKIIDYTTDLKEHIKILNLEWIEVYFKVEDKDKKVLSNPQEEILDKGGKIFYARYQNRIVGTVSLLKMDGINDEITFELTKMAVTSDVQGLGVGKKLMEHVLMVAKIDGIHKLIIFCNTKLSSAIHLYLKYGFIEVELEKGVYERANIKLERMI